MWSIPRRCLPRLCTICTAVAPDAVFTFRTNDPTPTGYREDFLVHTPQPATPSQSDVYPQISAT